ncbi:CLUMA_CG012146, isoform A [Clunio marinus]|uniref:peptidylprolyl isomerase n=1 Tax=Clunio marinus TaxID=568069 RepID=A0A1J1IKU1_9DIPT|nr:CLUMA_CG012146, isoform A [Clunio marinus]
MSESNAFTKQVENIEVMQVLNSSTDGSVTFELKSGGDEEENKFVKDVEKEVFDRVFYNIPIEVKNPCPIEKTFLEYRYSMKEISKSLYKKVIEAGNGSDIYLDDCIVNYDYSMFLEGSEGPFDSSILNNSIGCINVSIGIEPLPGCRLALSTMKKGEEAIFWISHELMFGKLGCPPRVPPKADILFQAKIKSVSESEKSSNQNLERELKNLLKGAAKKSLIAAEHYKFGDYQSAIGIYRKWINILDGSPIKNCDEEEALSKVLIKLYNNVIVCYNKINKPEKACIMIRYLEKLISIRDQPRMLLEKGKSNMMLQHYEEARRCFNLVRKCCPNFPKLIEAFEELDKQEELSKQHEAILDELSFDIDVKSNGLERNELNFISRLDFPAKSSGTFNVHGFDQKFPSFAIFQLHSFYYNMSLSFTPNITEPHETGTNIGLILKSHNSTITLHIWNDNNDTVSCMAALVIYNRTTPIPGGCPKSQPMLTLRETEDFVIVETTIAEVSPKEHDKRGSVRCLRNSTKPLHYFTNYIYLERMNFNHETYFNGIKSMIFDVNPPKSYRATQNFSPFHRYFEKVPGTGIIFNSFVVDRKGRTGFYIPKMTDSCLNNIWNSHCNNISLLKQSIGFVLVMFSLVMTFNLLMPDIIEAGLNGMFIGSFFMIAFLESRHVTMTKFDIFMTTIFSGLISSALFATISLRYRVGRYLSKLLFSNITIALIMELFFNEITSIYLQFGLAFFFSLALGIFRISFSVFLGGFALINGLSYLSKCGNIHRIFVDNFHALFSAYNTKDHIWSLYRRKFINSKIFLNWLDYSLITVYVVGAVMLTIRKEIYSRNIESHNELLIRCGGDVDEYNRNVARYRRNRCLIGIPNSSSARHRFRIISPCRRHHYRSNIIHERSPLISHWLASDESEDDVFESPISNSRFMQTLPPDSRERIEAIQNFHDDR